MRPLTPRQAEILALIQEFVDERGFPPTRAEIAERLGFRSANAAEEHLRALERKGVIELLPGASRGIQLKQAGLPGLPLIGRVAAGTPILAEENVRARHKIDPSLFSPRADFLLEVKGDSMIKVGIFDGDLLAVHKTSDARSGQIVVARIEGEVTVKRLRRRGSAIELHPENDALKPIVVDSKASDFAIEGLAVGVIRTGVSI
ncbi:MAG: transcriptional repressor LexA [Casimicrobiaceae bacterium]|nr:transcriptional repressor LexA [Casimicrobiaceae bacterium]MDW8312348.1 transcriptional repressor LexA [Burkholderiales bacterium]